MAFVVPTVIKSGESQSMQTGDQLQLPGALNEFKGADIASATTTNIGAATGNYINITGTTTITAFDTVQAGTKRVLNFNGALTLTYNATSLILPGSTNILTVAGDIAEFLSLGSGNWTCTSYQRSSSLPLLKSNNLSDVLSTSTARSNLGLGGIAVNNYQDEIIGYQALGAVVIAQSTGVRLIDITASNNMASGTEYYVQVILDTAATLTGIYWYQGVKGSFTSNNQNRIGLYTYSAGTMTLVASSTDDGTLWSTAPSNTFGNKAFTSTYPAAAGTYYVGLLWSSSATTTSPSLGSSGATFNINVLSGLFTNSAKLSGGVAGQTILALSQVMSGVTTANSVKWVGVY